jgi:phosphoglycerate dehydrogenase-like enzyme
LRVVIAIHDHPVWSMPQAESRRVAGVLAADEVVDVRDEAARAPAIASADVVFTARLSMAELAGAGRLVWVHSPSVGVGAIVTDALGNPVDKRAGY